MKSQSEEKHTNRTVQTIKTAKVTNIIQLAQTIFSRIFVILIFQLFLNTV